jgi:lactate dehydrogenase-like 2-hydroxyacid dehydrogenase
VARRARAFGLQIHYHNRKPVSPRIDEELEATYWDSLDQMLARMDIVRPLAAHAGHLPPAVGAAAEAAAAARHRDQHRPRRDHRRERLADLLASGKIAGAGLDVFEFEPRINPKLLKLPNAVLLPHIGSPPSRRASTWARR